MTGWPREKSKMPDCTSLVCPCPSCLLPAALPRLPAQVPSIPLASVSRVQSHSAPCPQMQWCKVCVKDWLSLPSRRCLLSSSGGNALVRTADRNSLEDGLSPTGAQIIHSNVSFPISCPAGLGVRHSSTVGVLQYCRGNGCCFKG